MKKHIEEREVVEKKKKRKENYRLKRNRCEAETQQAAADYQEKVTASKWGEIATATRVNGGEEGGVPCHV